MTRFYEMAVHSFPNVRRVLGLCFVTVYVVLHLWLSCIGLHGRRAFVENTPSVSSAGGGIGRTLWFVITSVLFVFYFGSTIWRPHTFGDESSQSVQGRWTWRVLSRWTAVLSFVFIVFHVGGFAYARWFSDEVGMSTYELLRIQLGKLPVMLLYDVGLLAVSTQVALGLFDFAQALKLNRSTNRDAIIAFFSAVMGVSLYLFSLNLVSYYASGASIF